MRKTFKHAKFTATFTDENGYFSLTGECDGASGAVGERIVEIDNQFAPLHAMHLADCNTGAPMHAWANALYFYKQEDFKALARHFRSEETAQEYATILNLMNAAQALRKDVSSADDRFVKPLDTRLSKFKAKMEEVWANEAEAIYTLVEEIPANLCKGFVDPYDSDGNPISEEYETFLDGFSEPEKAIAAAMQEDVDVLEVTEDGTTYTAASCEYQVLTDDEADEAWDVELESYIDDCLEIPESIEPYFDREAWKRDARMDGRGHGLGRHDGNEYDQTVNGTTYYLYRQ